MWEIRKRFKDYEQRKVFAGVLDEQTLMTLYKLSNKGVFDVLHGFIKQGKESSVVLAENKKSNEFYAVKIHAISAYTFKRIRNYIEGDPRFFKIKHNRRALIFAWCKKEFKNLRIAHEKARIPCPKPVAYMNNVIVMEFLGEVDNEQILPAPRLCDVELENPKKVFEKIIESVKKLYSAGIVHGDLSGYNILYFNNIPYFIDFSQGMPVSYANAFDLLKRDVYNICREFSEYGIESDPEKIIEDVTKGVENEV